MNERYRAMNLIKTGKNRKQNRVRDGNSSDLIYWKELW